MFKKLWKDEPVIVVVVLAVVLILISIVLAGVYLQRYGPKDKGPCMDCGGFGQGLVPTPFTNPVEGQAGKTSNGGGWVVYISAVSSTTTLWSSVTVRIVKNSLAVYRATGIKSATADIYSINLTRPLPKWYLYENDATSLAVRYSKGLANSTPFPKTNIDTTYGNLTDLETAQGVWFIVIDTDGSGTVTAGDTVLVFENPNVGTTQIVGGTGWELELDIAAGQIGSAQLA